MTRSEDFADGAEKVRQPQFRSVQQQHDANFRAMSVLDLPSSLPNQNGMGSGDLHRRMMGFQGSVSGRSETTVDSQMWLGNRESAQRSEPRKKEV